jgi:hypothetical protein
VSHPPSAPETALHKNCAVVDEELQFQAMWGALEASSLLLVTLSLPATKENQKLVMDELWQQTKKHEHAIEP